MTADKEPLDNPFKHFSLTTENVSPLPRRTFLPYNGEIFRILRANMDKLIFNIYL